MALSSCENTQQSGWRKVKIFIFGLGYSALHFAKTHHAHFSVSGTVTSADKARALQAAGFACHVFSGAGFDAALRQDVLEADGIVVSIPPQSSGDGVLPAFADVLAQCRQLTSLVYLSTVGVYGDYQGAWVDESSPCKPVNPRSQERLIAEQDWLRFGQSQGVRVNVLRLSGIYGPGQNAFVALANGTAKRIIKADQVFNRIHVDDIAGAISLCLTQSAAQGVWNVTDDLPAPPQDVVTCAAKIMGVEPPPEVAFADAMMSPMARSFYSECKRVSNARIKQSLGWQLVHPTYEQALKAMWAEKSWR